MNNKSRYQIRKAKFSSVMYKEPDFYLWSYGIFQILKAEEKSDSSTWEYKTPNIYWDVTYSPQPLRLYVSPSSSACTSCSGNSAAVWLLWVICTGEEREQWWLRVLVWISWWGKFIFYMINLALGTKFVLWIHWLPDFIFPFADRVGLTSRLCGGAILQAAIPM